MKIEAIREEGQKRKSYKALTASSGAANTALIEDEHFYFVHGGRQPEAFELGGDSTFVICVGGVSSLKEIHLADWGTCVWRGNMFGRVIPSTSEHLLGWPAAAIMHSGIALSRANVDEPRNVENASETGSAFAGASPEAEFETYPWRGTYCLAHTEKILFLQNVEFKTSDLPRWKPRVIIDRHRP
ncbi:MAG: hypothetical protein HY694_06175 [Deltaproteobacteria bacterium]|nr:hypothetical protein [Deltaproteobacteria bacterium]